MALTPPTVVTDPSDPTETNTALTTINDYVETSKNEVLEALRVLRAHIQTVTGSMTILDALDGATAAMKTARTTDPSVASSPVSQTSMNAASASMNSIVDSHRQLVSRAFNTTIAHANQVGVSFAAKEAFETLSATAGGAGGAVTVPSNPVSAAEMNTALASITANVDTANASAANALRAFVPIFYKNPGLLELIKRLEGGITDLSTP